MGVDIKFSQSYFWLDFWILANILQLGTQSFCQRFLDHKIDPGHRLYDQMIMAARCGVANIAEGTSRHNTSFETEMRLLDVARLGGCRRKEGCTVGNSGDAAAILNVMASCQSNRETAR